MGHPWIITCLGIAFLPLLFILPVAAYDNAIAHPAIQSLAVAGFQQGTMLEDPFLKNTSLNGSPAWGYAWDITDGPRDAGPRDSVNRLRQKTLEQWIIDGGYSADEPETTMALVHFHDPTNAKEPWLTDQSWLQNDVAQWVARIPYGKNFTIPRISAKQWAFEEYQKVPGEYYLQDYSFPDALRYYQQALASKDRFDPGYGKAWRAVGETMHLVSDMTVPAHVRNDGHVTFQKDILWLLNDPDPYESAVGYPEVRDRASQGKPADIDYDSGDLSGVMDRIARFSNQNFLSSDSSPYLVKRGQNPEFIEVFTYPSPSVSGPGVPEKGYVTWRLPGGRETVLAKKTSHIGKGWDTALFRTWYSFDIDRKVIENQQQILLPTAVRGSEEVLDRFLPRFDARLTVDKYLPDDLNDDQYLLNATLVQVKTGADAWKDVPSGLVVRNGASLVVITPDGKESVTDLPLVPLSGTPRSDPDFNHWKDLFRFTPGSRIMMKYDLGGYVIRSNEVFIEVPKSPGPGTPTLSSHITPSPPGLCVPVFWGSGTYTQNMTWTSEKQKAKYTSQGGLILYGGDSPPGEYIVGRPEVTYEWETPYGCIIAFEWKNGGPDPGSGTIDDYLTVGGKRFAYSSFPCVEKGKTVKEVIFPYPDKGCYEVVSRTSGNGTIEDTYSCGYLPASGTLCITFQYLEECQPPGQQPGTSPPTLSPTPTWEALTSTPSHSATSFTPGQTLPRASMTSGPVSLPPILTISQTVTRTPLQGDSRATTPVPPTSPTRASLTQVALPSSSTPTTVRPPPLQTLTQGETRTPGTVSIPTPSTIPLTVTPVPTATKPPGTPPGGPSGTPVIFGTAQVPDWDTTGDSFGFRTGTCTACGYTAPGSDLFIADRGKDAIIHVYDSPGVADLGSVPFESVVSAPGIGYQDGATPVSGHTYAIRSRGTYGKITITAITSKTGSPTVYSIRYAYAPGGLPDFGQQGARA